MRRGQLEAGAEPQPAPLQVAAAIHPRIGRARLDRMILIVPSRLALHTWTLDSTPLAEVLRIARRTGWQAIELRRADFARALETGQSAADVLQLVRTNGL